MMFESQKRVVKTVQSLKFPKIKKIDIYMCVWGAGFRSMFFTL